MEKTRKKSGFTLIELLVVIVIIGLLATISAATFGKYFGKARDAVRTAAVSQMTNIIKVDGADKWDDSKFFYDVSCSGPDNTVPNLIDPTSKQYFAGTTESACGNNSSAGGLIEDNDFRLPKADNDICYLIGMGLGSKQAGDDNEFFVAVWGEETSSDNPSESGLIIDGTTKAVATVKGLDGLEASSFSCDKDFSPTLTGTSVSDVLGSGTHDAKYGDKNFRFYKIDKDGKINTVTIGSS